MPVLRDTSQVDGPRLCFIGNPDSIHVWRWAQHFAGRGFDVHIVSFYSPKLKPAAGVTVDFLRQRAEGTGTSGARSALSRAPGLLRLATAARLVRAGFRSAVTRLEPDLVHAHYVSDYGFLAALTGRHPLVVSAWGSDLLLDPHRSVITRAIVRWVLSRAELVTYDAGQVAAAARRLGAPPKKMLEVVMGVEDDYLRLAAVAPPPARRDPLIVSLRSLARPLYNVEVVVRAMPEVLRAQPDARLVIGNDGALRPDLERLAAELGISPSVEFVGVVERPKQLAELLGRAAVYVSVPSSDGTSATLLEAMAAGAFPVVSDLPSNSEWIDETGGDVVPVGGVPQLAAAIVRGLSQPDLRERAATRNLEVVRRRGLWEANMARVEDAYRRLIAGSSAGGSAGRR
jgi:glycosyltransferase involved in cell wall biosynthesis